MQTHPHKLMSKEKAEDLAVLLNAEAEADGDDGDCKYKAIHDPKGTGLSFVGIVDENDEVIFKL